MNYSYLCKFINIQQSTKTDNGGGKEKCCVSLSISNRVLKLNKQEALNAMSVSLSISNRVLKHPLLKHLTACV